MEQCDKAIMIVGDNNCMAMFRCDKKKNHKRSHAKRGKTNVGMSKKYTITWK